MAKQKAPAFFTELQHGQLSRPCEEYIHEMLALMQLLETYTEERQMSREYAERIVYEAEELSHTLNMFGDGALLVLKFYNQIFRLTLDIAKRTLYTSSIIA